MKKITFPESKEFGNKIEKMVVDFINSKEAKKTVKDAPYIVSVMKRGIGD